MRVNGINKILIKLETRFAKHSSYCREKSEKFFFHWHDISNVLYRHEEKPVKEANYGMSMHFSQNALSSTSDDFFSFNAIQMAFACSLYIFLFAINMSGVKKLDITDKKKKQDKNGKFVLKNAMCQNRIWRSDDAIRVSFIWCICCHIIFKAF